MKKTNQKTVTLVVRVREDQKSWIDSKSAQGGIDLSKFVRVMIDSFRSFDEESKNDFSKNAC